MVEKLPSVRQASVEEVGASELDAIELEALVRELQLDCTPRQRAFLGMIAMHVQYGADLAVLTSRLSADMPRTPLEARRRTRKFYWARMKRFSQSVAEGDSWDVALGKHPELLPQSAELVLRLQNQIDGAKSLFRVWLERAPSFHADPKFNSSFVAVWFRQFFLCLFFVIGISFVMTKVVPELKTILSEFNIPLPPILDWTILVADTCVKFWFLPALIVILALPFYFREVFRWLKSLNPMTWNQRRLSVGVRRRNLMAMIMDQTEPVALDKLDGLRQVKKDLFLSAKKRRKDAPVPLIKLDSHKLKKSISSREIKALETAATDSTRAWVLRYSAGLFNRRKRDQSSFRAWFIICGINVFFGAFVIALALSLFSVLLRIMENFL